MDFNPSLKHNVVRNTVREFAEAELAPIAADIDREARFPWEVIERMRELNFFGLQAPRELGGAGLDTVSYCIAIEELCRVSAAVGLCITVHNSVALFPVYLFGTEEQKERLAKPLASGEAIGAFCLTEAGAGSDASAVETTAVRDGDDYIISGAKIFVTNGGVCGQALVFAKTDQGPAVFVIENDRPGYVVGEIEDLCGMRANPVSSLFFEDCRVPAANMLGKPGQGLAIGLTALDAGRLGIAAQALGIAQAAFEASVKYAKERRQFKQPIAKFQTIQNYLADMATNIDAARLLLHRACGLRDGGKPYSAESAMAKLFCAQTAMAVADKAVQIHGGYGYSREYDVERFFREAKICEIYEGTNEVQRLVIARSVLAKPSQG